MIDTEKPIFDWNEFIQQSHISQQEWELASEMAGCWKKDYVFQHCGNNIERNDWFEPLDKEMFKLGDEFNDAIKKRWHRHSKYLMFKIERRYCQMIKTNKP